MKTEKGFIDPERVLDQLELMPAMIVADFGCGTGGFTIPLAKRLESGLVYALDVQEQPLNALKANSISSKIINIRFVKADLEKAGGSRISDGFVDLVLIANAIFQANNKAGMISEAKRVLKPNGKLVIIDYKKDAAINLVQKTANPEELSKAAERLGFKLKKELRVGNSHFGLVFIKE